ncbi:hypothetical protein M2447_002782 [Ereboglobus sp. PH5-10]|uniref:plasmid recombination protein n=1 Tax=Ereboglobus sp. PH5-10 TaxID=2940629 RepID=UPI002404CC8F|nr:plasmid recombination protein [Ereboglobus sp. PH5-10]MDF9828654.1 hypothetical protein [Ereboglobus sp. PH5-10]
MNPKSIHYALVRTAKLVPRVPRKGMNRSGRTYAENIDDTADHELRLKTVPNANPGKKDDNHLILFEGDKMIDMPFKDAREKGYMHRNLFYNLAVREITAKGIDMEKLRKDYVLAHQVMISASHDFFKRGTAPEREPGKPAKSGSLIIDDDYFRWRKDVIQFLINKFRGLIVAIVEHLDETTPHLTAIIVPLIFKEVNSPGRRGSKSAPAARKEWRLCASALFTPSLLRKLWSELAIAMKPHKLHRPPKWARVNHETINEFYYALAEGKIAAETFKKLMNFQLPAPNPGLFGESLTAYHTRAQKAVEENNHILYSHVDLVHYQALAYQKTKDEIDQLRLSLEQCELALYTARENATDLEKQLANARTKLQPLHLCSVPDLLGLKSAIEGGNIYKLADDRIIKLEDRKFIVYRNINSKKAMHFGEGASEFLAYLFDCKPWDAARNLWFCFGERAAGELVDCYKQSFRSTPNQEFIKNLLARFAMANKPIETVKPKKEDAKKETTSPQKPYFDKIEIEEEKDEKKSHKNYQNEREI